jgi:hypothetical protein
MKMVPGKCYGTVKMAGVVKYKQHRFKSYGNKALALSAGRLHNLECHRCQLRVTATYYSGSKNGFWTWPWPMKTCGEIVAESVMAS